MRSCAGCRGQPNGPFSRGAGATLVELVVVIVIAGIVASVASVFISRPVQGYVDLGRRATLSQAPRPSFSPGSRTPATHALRAAPGRSTRGGGHRATLVDAAESAVRRMARDIRTALPNSARVTNTPGGGFALELVPIVDGGKYTTDGAGEIKINLHGNFDADFDNLGCFQVIAPGTYTNYRIAINNLGTSGFNVYTTTGASGVITPVGLQITVTNNAGATCSPSSPFGTVGDQHIHFNANHAFSDSSPVPWVKYTRPW